MDVWVDTLPSQQATVWAHNPDDTARAMRWGARVNFPMTYSNTPTICTTRARTEQGAGTTNVGTIMGMGLGIWGNPTSMQTRV